MAHRGWHRVNGQEEEEGLGDGRAEGPSAAVEPGSSLLLSHRFQTSGPEVKALNDRTLRGTTQLIAQKHL